MVSESEEKLEGLHAFTEHVYSWAVGGSSPT
jgi:hypothetical protein